MNIYLLIALLWYCKIAYFTAVIDSYKMFRDTPKKFHDDITFVITTILLAPIAMTIRWVHKQWENYNV